MMPLRVTINGKERVITPTEAKQTLDFPEEIKTFEVNRNFYFEAAKSELSPSLLDYPSATAGGTDSMPSGQKRHSGAPQRGQASDLGDSRRRGQYHLR